MKKQTVATEQTLVLLKPSQALRRLGPIRSRIAKAGTITEARMIQTTSEVMDVFCKHLSPVYKQATIEHYGNQIVPIFVIQGEHIITRVSQLVGTEVNPEWCSQNSIRHQMWREFGRCDLIIPHGLIYVNNFIHCSRTPREAQEQIQVVTNPNIVSFKI